MHVSDLTDALGDLLRSLVQVSQGYDSRFSWDGEPTEYRWIFIHQDDTLQVRILSFDDRRRPEPDEAGWERFTLWSEPRPIVDAVVQSARRVLSATGEEEYARQWDGEAFPLHELNILEFWLKDH
ncbi:hypothetical protein ITP53_39620 [Nonomuraea sp. K274]|uniref:Uncharacterized protein n=1 Tax=Nonomuraea cypriaca TaxID=1187855 RepID=A0A931AHE3_9ACTN|nr:hypothetical protein [Nonomuraea cypriaca]MBF8191700.1 hypothetical protein [Nonomuraea cypriaca]